MCGCMIALLAATQAHLFQRSTAEKVWNQSFLHPPFSHSIPIFSHLARNTCLSFSSPPSPPSPPSEWLRWMDRVCWSPWLNCRSADVAPSPLTASWRLYLSLHDAVSLAHFHTYILHTHRCMIKIGTCPKHAQSCINTHLHRNSFLSLHIFMCPHEQAHGSMLILANLASLSLSVCLVTPISLHPVPYIISISLYCHTHTHSYTQALIFEAPTHT